MAGLQPVDDGVQFADVRFVVYNTAIHFYPSVGFKWHLLDANDHFRVYPTFAEKAGCCGGTLQAQHLFPVPDARHIHSRANTLKDVWTPLERIRRTPHHLAMESAEPPLKIEVEEDQCQIGSHGKKLH